MPKFIAYDINWDIDMDNIFSAFDEMTVEKASNILGIPCTTYSNMTTEERHDYIYDTYHHNRKSASELFDLPEEIEIPDVFEIKSENDDMSDVTDWISDEYGWCINGYSVKAA